MTFIFKNSHVFILVSVFISCNGQVKNEKPSADTEKVAEDMKISVPENGFSNAYLDKDGSIWFSSNGGGIYHYDGKTYP